MRRGLGARRHLMQCVRRTLKKRLSKIKMSILPRGHIKKKEETKVRETFLLFVSLVNILVFFSSLLMSAWT